MSKETEQDTGSEAGFGVRVYRYTGTARHSLLGGGFRPCFFSVSGCVLISYQVLFPQPSASCPTSEDALGGVGLHRGIDHGVRFGLEMQSAGLPEPFERVLPIAR